MLLRSALQPAVLAAPQTGGEARPDQAQLLHLAEGGGGGGGGGHVLSAGHTAPAEVRGGEESGSIAESGVSSQ